MMKITGIHMYLKKASTVWRVLSVRIRSVSCLAGICLTTILGGKALLPVAFMYIPALLASHDWMQRHAGLMAVAAIAEGTHQIMEKELGNVVSYVRSASHLVAC
jgi:hypothetical protein